MMFVGYFYSDIFEKFPLGFQYSQILNWDILEENKLIPVLAKIKSYSESGQLAGEKLIEGLDKLGNYDKIVKNKIP